MFTPASRSTAATRVEVVVAEHRADRHAQVAACVGKHLRLLGLAERRQIAGEQDEIDALLQLRERLREPTTRRLRSMDVTGCGDRHHAVHVPQARGTGNRPRWPSRIKRSKSSSAR
jgi:hypothetical protein